MLGGVSNHCASVSGVGAGRWESSQALLLSLGISSHCGRHEECSQRQHGRYFSLSVSLSFCLCLCVCLSLCFLLFVVVVFLRLNLILSLPFPRSLCKLPRMFAYYKNNLNNTETGSSTTKTKTSQPTNQPTKQPTNQPNKQTQKCYSVPPPPPPPPPPPFVFHCYPVFISGRCNRCLFLYVPV